MLGISFVLRLLFQVALKATFCLCIPSCLVLTLLTEHLFYNLVLMLPAPRCSLRGIGLMHILPHLFPASQSPENHIYLQERNPAQIELLS